MRIDIQDKFQFCNPGADHQLVLYRMLVDNGHEIVTRFGLHRSEYYLTYSRLRGWG